MREDTAIEKVRGTKRGMTQSRARAALRVSTVTWGGMRDRNLETEFQLADVPLPTPSLYSFWTRIPSSSTRCSTTSAGEKAEWLIVHWCCSRPGHCSGSHAGETSRVKLWQFSGTQSHSKLPLPLALTVFPSLPLKWSLNLGCRSYIVDVLIRAKKGNTM